MVFNWPMMMLVSIRTTYTSIFWNTFKKVYILVRNPRQPVERPAVDQSSRNKKLRLRKELKSYITFSNMIVFEKGFFFNRRGGHGHSSILKFRLVFKGKSKRWSFDRLSRIPNQNVNFFESVSKNWCVRCPNNYQHHHRSIKYQALR